MLEKLTISQNTKSANDVAIKHISHYAMGTLPTVLDGILSQQFTYNMKVNYIQVQVVYSIWINIDLPDTSNLHIRPGKYFLRKKETGMPSNTKLALVRSRYFSGKYKL